jgi:hypothetical protein
MNHAAAIVFLAPLALAAVTRPVQGPAEAGADPVARGWSARAALATQRLAGGGLDVCDRALERAFQGAKLETQGAKRMYLLRIEIDGDALLTTYGYDGERLEDFGVVALPPGWFLRQPAGSRTLTVLLSKKNCAFDLCPGDPFSGAPCPDAQAH